MDQGVAAEETARITVHNIGGIDQTTVEFTPGVTALVGRNATNRTSLLHSIMAVLGSDNASLKADADEGTVELSIGNETYTRRLTRQDESIVMDGTPYLEDPMIADLFAFLLESNEARQAVAQDDDLREIIMRPVDTEEINAEIQRLEAERDDIDTELQELSRLERELPDLEERRQQLARQIEETRAELDAKVDTFDALDTDIEETREEQAELEAKLDELREVRGTLENVRHRIDTEKQSIDALQNEQNELQSELAEYSGGSDERISELNDRIQQLRGQVQTIDATVDELQSIIQFNERLREDSPSAVVDDLQEADRSDDASITDQLVETEDGIICWTCGSAVEISQIDVTLDRLRGFRNQKMEERRTLRKEIDDLQEEHNALEEKHHQREQIQRKLQQIEEELDDRKARVEDLQFRREELLDTIDTLEEEVEELRTESYEEILDAHKETNQLEFELDRLQNELDTIDDEIQFIEERVAERDQLLARRDDIRSELEELRTRIERLEKEAIEQFNDHMDAVLDLLGYENLERIWIERTEQEVQDGRRTVTVGRFTLHVVRSTASDSVYEDTVEHLSESEREVTGLVFALAGYLVHDVYEEVPFMLLDSVEALDPERVARLIHYLDEYADHLVAALLPEDAAHLDDDYQRITEI